MTSILNKPEILGRESLQRALVRTITMRKDGHGTLYRKKVRVLLVQKWIFTEG